MNKRHLETYSPRFWWGNLKYIIATKRQCSWLGQDTFCNKKATRFELWEGGDFSISCKEHHKFGYQKEAK